MRFRVRNRLRVSVMGSWAPGPLGPTVKLMRFRAHKAHEI